MSKLHFLILLSVIVSVFCIEPQDIGCTGISTAEFEEKDATCSKCEEDYSGNGMIDRCRSDCYSGPFFKSCVELLNKGYDEKDENVKPEW
uniref:Alpha-latrotoxin associated low molecular weight protein SGV242-280 n=1 Tax=Steatoda grossa TaxID=256750 RepID=TXAD_STEGR|nr:RecName: Full=Alpha-latrotoxin associated low molecular weight protein SGV242-280; Short=Alpha-latrotoxin-associated LMWP SGV242-280; AltName: Full=Latrodectin; Flags: Precursor [Steatoda grossa]AHC13261.1 alpha-latrotoxin associated low molecular weight protein [Steatoda grossa]